MLQNFRNTKNLALSNSKENSEPNLFSTFNQSKQRANKAIAENVVSPDFSRNYELKKSFFELSPGDHFDENPNALQEGEGSLQENDMLHGNTISDLNEDLAISSEQNEYEDEGEEKGFYENSLEQENPFQPEEADQDNEQLGEPSEEIQQECIDENNEIQDTVEKETPQKENMTVQSNVEEAEKSATMNNSSSSLSFKGEPFNLIENEFQDHKDEEEQEISGFQNKESERESNEDHVELQPYAEKNENIDLGLINNALYQFHEAFSHFSKNQEQKNIPEYEIYKLIDEQVLRILPEKSTTVTKTLTPLPCPEKFTYLDARDFYCKERKHLARSSSLKELTTEIEYDIRDDESFDEYYHRYLKPMREKIEEYTEKINNLIKDKELEFFTMNEIIKNLISNFSKERQQLEAEILDKNISIAKLKEALEELQEAFEAESHRNILNKEGTMEIDLPRQISSIPPQKSKTLTPEKLYSFRAISAHKNSKLRSKEKHKQHSPKTLNISNWEEEKGLHNRSLPQWQDTRNFKGTLPLRLHRNSPDNSPKEMNEIELAPDLINISQINFDTNPDDFSMTNNLFAEKPTSRFMDRDDIYEYQQHQREFNKSSSRKGSNGHGEIPAHYLKGKNDHYQQHNTSKNWIIREEDSYYKGGDHSMRMPEYDLIKTMNENLLTKMIQSDNEKSKLLDFVERLVFDKKETSERESSTKNSLERQEKDLMTMRETCQKEKEQLEKEKKEIEEAKEQLKKEKEELAKKKESLKEYAKMIQSKSAKQLAEKDLQLLLMEKKIESKKKTLEDEWNKIDTMKKDVKKDQEKLASEWKKMNNDSQELERLYQVYEQSKEELAQERKTLKTQYEYQLREIEKRKKELYEEEKKIKNEKRILRKHEEQLAEEREELAKKEEAFDEERKYLVKRIEYLETSKERKDQKIEFCGERLRSMSNRMKKTTT